MSTWWHLVKKEFRLGMPALLFTVIAWIVVLGLTLYFGTKHGHGLEAITIASIVLIGAHVLYLLCYMLFSLQSERKKLHLWLHNPLPGSALLLAKLVAGLASMTITLFISCIVVFVGWTGIPMVSGISITWSQFLGIGTFSLLHIYLIAIDFAIWFTFFWMFFRMLSRRLGGFTSFIATLVFVGILSYFYGMLNSSGLYYALTSWGAIPLPASFGEVIRDNGSTFTFHIYLGYYIFEAFIVLILFFLSSWILDRKVEV